MPLILAAVVLLVGFGTGVAWYSGLLEALVGPKKKSVPSFDPNEFCRAQSARQRDAALQSRTEARTSGPPLQAMRRSSPTSARRRTTASSIPPATSTAERDKAICRRMAAELALLNGDVPEARNQIEQLRKRTTNLDFYAIPPLVEIGWHEHAAGRADAALAAAQQASETAKALPPFGRETAEISIQFATLLAALGKTSEAEALVAGQEKKEQQLAYGRLSTPLLESTTRTGPTTSTPRLATEPMLPWTAPSASP